MNIAHLLPYSASFPLTRHQGRYAWALKLALAQAHQGHRVTLYCGPSSDRDFPQIQWRTLPIKHAAKQAANRALMLQAFKTDHDVFHSHYDSLHYLLADHTKRTIVATQHWFPNREIAKAATQNHTSNVLAVPSSQLMADTDDTLGIKHSKIIRQGIDLTLFHPTNTPLTDRLIFIGRIAPWKGVLEAVRIAQASHQALDIVGKLNPTEHDYWRKVEPFIDEDRIRYLGPKDQTEVAQLLAGAKGFLFPSQAPEAAPQAPIEAQACGTPVIMSAVGATNEWLKPGITGYIATSFDDFIEALKNLDRINRIECRKFAEKFDLKIMVDLYDNLYTGLYNNS